MAGDRQEEHDPTADEIGARAERKLRARAEGRHGLLFGLGMFGLIGWAIAVPTLIGIAVGSLLDRAYPAGFSWTLSLLFAGVALGCWNAWYWLRTESSDD